MTAASPWSVKGIDPKAREVAKDLARRSGMTLGEWLNRMIIEGDGQAPDLGSESAPNRAYLEVVKEDAPPRMEIAEHPADEVGRVAIALDRLTQRIEAAEGRSAAAISGIDHSVRDALTRLGQSEREQIAVAARFEGAVDELKTEQARAAERMRRIESEAAGPRSAEALRALEGALGKVAGHLYEGEARTRDAIAALEARLNQQSAAPQDPTALVDAVVARLGERLEAAEARTSEALRDMSSSFAALDQRMGAVEGANPAAGVQERLDSLALSLSQKMEAARLEMAAKLRESADGRFDRMERKLGEMAAHVQAAEQRSAQAIERMGREVVGVADAFNRRVQAQALEKLGGEIARITEKLAERIGAAERRNALAIDDVGEQVARVTERLNQRHERSSQELVDRIRQSEERTLRMLEEARDKIDTRLHDAQRKLDAPAPAAPASAPARPAPPVHSPFDETYFSQAASFSHGGHDDHVAHEEEDVFEAPAAPTRASAFEVAEFPAAEPEERSFGHDDYALADGFEPEAPRYEVEPQVSDFAPAEPTRPMSTRDIIEQARAAARAAAAADAKPSGKYKPGKAEKKAKAPKAGGSSLFGGFGFANKKSKARLGATVATAVMVFGGAGALGAGVGGLLLLNTDGSGAAPTRVAQAIAGRQADVVVTGPEADTTPNAPRAAVALTAGPATPIQAEAPVSPTALDNGKALFEDGVRKIEGGDRSGLDVLKRAANGGYPAAQFYLSKMYESGKAGVKKDMPEARRWSERAATGGDARAMHNLALYYFKGEGGPRNVTTAATWFRKAADLGLVDSQFNLAQLYEGGYGVSQNPAEAYKWYVIAGRAGDATARSRAAALRSQLTAEAQQTADRSALAFRAQTQAQTASLSPTVQTANANLGLAQRTLSQLGYYQGPRDGVASPALRMAIAAYQRDQGLPASGSMDAETLNRLSVYAR